MDEKEIRELARLLEMVALPKDRGGQDGWIPDECLAAFHKLTVTPFYELVMHRKRQGVDEFLVKWREDGHWRGHHVPGGMLKPQFPSDPVSIAQRLIDREFSGLDLAVRSVRIVASYKWPEHPWCNPSADVLLVEVNGEIPETDGRRWITSGTMPKDMLPNHGMYIVQCHKLIQDCGLALTFTREQPYGIGLSGW